MAIIITASFHSTEWLTLGVCGWWALMCACQFKCVPIQMGCGSSSESVTTGNFSPQPSEYYIDRASNSRKNSQIDRSILETFVRLDEEICSLEDACVGPRLVTVEAWVKYLESRRRISPNDIIQLPLHMLDDEFVDEHNDEKYSRRARLKADVDSFAKVRQLVEKLNVMTNVTQAIKHEEFVANVGRRYTDNWNEILTEEILENARNRASKLRERWTILRTKYNEMDALIMSTGNDSDPNELACESELEQLRQIRDKLSSVVEQWRNAANLLRTSAKSAILAKEQYALIATSNLVAEKITLTMDCRASILGSLIAIRCAQEALPNVDMPHITNRQIVAVSHANEYLFTDTVNTDRYQHTKCVLDAYQRSLSESVTWLYNIFNNTLKKDLDNAKLEANAVALKLRDIRAHNIQLKIGYRPHEPTEQGQPFHIADPPHP